MNPGQMTTEQYNAHLGYFCMWRKKLLLYITVAGDAMQPTKPILSLVEFY